MPKSKAQVTVDMAVGMIIFVSMVAVAFYYISYISAPKQPFESTLRGQGLMIAEELRNNVSWTIYRAPVWVTSGNSSLWNLELQFRPDAATDSNSVAVLGANLTEIPSAYSDNTVAWVSNISAGKTKFYLAYSKNTTLAAQSYSTDLNASGLWANNSAMNVLFSATGISSINFGGTEILGNGISLGTSTAPANAALSVRAKISYPEGIYAKVYSNLSKIVFSGNRSFNATIYLPPGFVNFYNGTENTFPASGGRQFGSILNFTDIYNSSRGVAVIGRDMNVSVYNTTYREIWIYNATDFEIYIHYGNYLQALAEKDAYLNAGAPLLGLPVQLSGVSLQQLQALSALPYADIRSRLAASSNFNMTIENTTAGIGKKIPDDRDVTVVSVPAAVLGRTGNITETSFSVAVWLGSDYA